MSSSKTKKDILIFTGTRADYGILKGLIFALEKNNNCSPTVLATGTHLVDDFGNTVQEIEANHKCPIQKINIPTENKEPADINTNMSSALLSFSNYLKTNHFDSAVVLGDRYEALAFSIAAYNLHIPIIHLHGGELTLGALDDNYRHSISKFSHLHLCSSQNYLNRLLQLGEDPSKIFNIGSIGFQNAKNLKLLDKKELEVDLNIVFNKDIITVAFHPETNSKQSPKAQIDLLLEVLKKFSDKNHIVFTSPNSDFGGDEIKKSIQNFIDENSGSFYFSSLGTLRFFSLLKLSKFLIGNSSSGVIEAPALDIYTINVGDRQAGRLRSPSIIDCLFEEKEITQAIHNVLKMPPLSGSHSPLDGGDSIKKAEKIIVETELKGINQKGFYDLESKYES